MKKIIQLILPMLCFLLYSNHANSQNIIYSDTFTQGSGYAAGTSQWDNWGTFRSALDTSTQTLLRVTVRGTLDQTGRTCTDRTIVRRLAAALRNATTYNATCGSFVWSVGNCGSGPELNVNSASSICACNVGWSVRPQINAGNQNWGGVNSNTCGGQTQRITVIFEKPSKPNDMGVLGITTPDLCNFTQTFDARMTNFGTTRVDSFRLYWSINGVTQTPFYVQSRLRPNRDTTLRLITNMSLTANTMYRFRVWTHRPNNQTDSIAENDTLRTSFFFLGNPLPPTTTNFVQCGNGFPRLRATPNSSADSILWFDQSTGGNLLGVGRNIQGPYLTSNRTFFAQSMKFGGTTNIGLGYGGTSILSAQANLFNGYTFNVTATKSVLVDSITVRLYWNYQNTNLRVYYKIGTHVGFQNNANAWTLVNSGQVRYFTQGGQFFGRLSTRSLLLQQGTTYGFYVTTDPTVGSGNDLWAKFGTTTSSNADVTITGGAYWYGLFAATGVFTPYSGDFELMTKAQCTNSTRTSLTVTVKPRPTGAELVTASPFQGQVKLGLPSNPDIIEVGKTLTYQLNPPTGFVNADHNNTWVVNNIVARTRGGFIVPSTEYTVVAPGTSGPGTITYIPKTQFLDSFITFSVNYSDLGPHFCDSTVIRTLVVASTPKPNFKFPQSICLGEATFFENTTTIHSGNNSFMWYFDDGDSSDLNSPVHEYKQSGVYFVKLVATSFPWKVRKDTTIVVEVGELPTVGFRVNNKCEGNAITFVNTTFVANGALSYKWNFGDGSPIVSTSSSATQSKTYPRAGSYRVTLTADANGCVSSLTKNAYVFAKPVSNFIAPSSNVCELTEAEFVNTSTISQGLKGSLWNMGNGYITTQNNVKYAYTTAGTYNVKLISVSEFECKDSITKQVRIVPTPRPNFAGDQFCDNKLTNFTNTSVVAVPGPVYNWTFSDGFTSQANNVINKAWAQNGPVTITLKSKYTNSCESSITKTVDVLIQPKAKFTVQDICSGESARFVNLTEGDKAGIQYLWDFGNGTDNTPAPVRLYTVPQTETFEVKLLATYPGGCTDTAKQFITVSETPTCDFTTKDNGFMNLTFTPSNTSYTKYEWFFGEGGYSTTPVSTYKFAYTGNFNVTMKATNSIGCECQITKRISANTSVNSLSKVNGISIYPNPNNGTFEIKHSANKAMKVEIYNVIGAKVYSQNSDLGALTVNLSGESSGVYLVKVTVDGITSVSKVTLAN
jgi:PKD repeat protein